MPDVPMDPIEASEPDPDPPEPEAGDDAALGDAGQRALQAERAAAKAAERRAKAAEKKLAEFEAANQSEAEKALEAARAEGRSEGLSVSHSRIVKAEIKAAASGILQDPEDALAHIDPEQFEVDEDGNVDVRAVKSAVSTLVAAKPYLTAGAKPAPLPGGGATPSKGSSMDDALRAAARGGGGRL